jgi:beta-glucosidase
MAGHAIIDAAPGDGTTVEVVLPKRSFEHWDAASACWSVEPGDYQIHVGSSVSKLRTSTSVTLG